MLSRLRKTALYSSRTFRVYYRCAELVGLLQLKERHKTKMPENVGHRFYLLNKYEKLEEYRGDINFNERCNNECSQT